MSSIANCAAVSVIVGLLYIPKHDPRGLIVSDRLNADAKATVHACTSSNLLDNSTELIAYSPAAHSFACLLVDIEVKTSEDEVQFNRRTNMSSP